MSYSIKILVVDGKPVVDEHWASPPVPDGEFMISGHEDESGRSIGIHRQQDVYVGERQQHKQVVVQAQGYASKA